MNTNISETAQGREAKLQVEPYKHADGTTPDDAWLRRYALIAKHPFFQGLSPKQLELLADDSLEMQFGANQVIFREGDSANRFYLILEGKVALDTEVAEGNFVQTQTLGPGEDLGWSWLFSPYYLQSSARAVEPTKALFFYGTRLREQCEADHDLGYEIMKRVADVIINRLQATRRQLLE